ncbi:hypothetical protein L1887_14915 [Cichorium endivia]|nr:hypothetical protein L1887_14915 [Cichorium endivia]
MSSLVRVFISFRLHCHQSSTPTTTTASNPLKLSFSDLLDLDILCFLVFHDSSLNLLWRSFNKAEIR